MVAGALVEVEVAGALVEVDFVDPLSHHLLAYGWLGVFSYILPALLTAVGAAAVVLAPVVAVEDFGMLWLMKGVEAERLPVTVGGLAVIAAVPV